jgi:hypothetical protein
MSFEIGRLPLGLVSNDSERRLKHTSNGLYYNMQLIFGRGIKVRPDCLEGLEAYFVFGAGCNTPVEVLVVQFNASYLQGIV